MADAVLASIITPEMDVRAKCRAIFDFVSKDIKYQSSPAAESVTAGALTAFSTYRGDCYAHYAAAEILLTRAGITNEGVTNLDNSHYWNLVEVDGTWYHFDATPNSRFPDTDRCLFTQAQAEEYTKLYYPSFNVYFYDYNKENYPKVS
jgi:transglutaminase/protease-like cytokinesis protein 3